MLISHVPPEPADIPAVAAMTQCHFQHRSVLAVIYSTNIALVDGQGGLLEASVPPHPSTANCSSQLDTWDTFDTLDIVGIEKTLEIVGTSDIVDTLTLWTC